MYNNIDIMYKYNNVKVNTLVIHLDIKCAI